MTAQAFIHISGLPCSGKSELGQRIQKSVPFISVDIEDVWHQTISNPTFSKQESEVVFAAFESQIENAIVNGHSILGESVLASEPRFFRLKRLAQKHGVRHLFVMAEATNDVLMARWLFRATTKPGTITEDMLHELKARFATRTHADLIFDTTHGINTTQLNTVIDWIHGTPVHP